MLHFQSQTPPFQILLNDQNVGESDSRRKTLGLNHNNQDSDNVPLVTFDGAEGTTYKFHVLNDPVMVRILFRFLLFLIIAWIII